jgi:hypothetical protein
VKIEISGMWEVVAILVVLLGRMDPMVQTSFLPDTP